MRFMVQMVHLFNSTSTPLRALQKNILVTFKFTQHQQNLFYLIHAYELYYSWYNGLLSTTTLKKKTLFPFLST